MTAAHDLQPVKASLVADLVGLININLADMVHVAARACPVCDGVGVVGDVSSGNEATCATCGGVGAVEQFVFDMARIKSPTIGRLVEGWDVKQGQLVPKLRSKDRAFALLVKLLGFDKAIVEIANGASFAESIPDEQRAAYVEQLKELAALGLLDGVRA